MKKRRHTPEQVTRKLADGEKLLGEGKTIQEVVHHLEITESTWHRWRNQYGGMKSDDAKELRELRKENAQLKNLATQRGASVFVRFDHGPQFIAYAVADWCRFNGTGTVFIDPGSPLQYAWIVSFSGRMRDEHLNGQQFDSLLEAQVLTED